MKNWADPITLSSTLHTSDINTVPLQYRTTKKQHFNGKKWKKSMAQVGYVSSGELCNSWAMEKTGLIPSGQYRFKEMEETKENSLIVDEAQQ